jgi:subtilisin family serine protease
VLGNAGTTGHDGLARDSRAGVAGHGMNKFNAASGTHDRVLSTSDSRWHAPMHQVRWLRWLRTGTLTLILAAGLLCLLVIYQAHRGITTAIGHGARAISEVGAAYAELAKTGNAVADGSRGRIPLLERRFSPGAYDEAITAAGKDLVLAAGNNVAGGVGSSRITIAEVQIGTYNDRVQQASIDLAGNKRSRGLYRFATLGGDYGFLRGEVLTSIRTLDRSERKAVAADLRSRWLRSSDFWWLLLTPFLAMVLLAAGTSYVLWHGFRRLFSVRLTAALLLMLALVGLVASLNMHDADRAQAFIHGLAVPGAQVPPATDVSFGYSVWTLAAVLLMTGGAGVLTFGAYRPRLYEYNYQAIAQ